MKATITSKGQITIPKALREKYHLRSGDVIDFDENAPVLTGRKGISSEAFQIARSLRKEENPFEGMTTMEIMEELRGPVDLPPEENS
jgi:AbrB family looped-hinge helix DNA binding protein